MTATLEADWWRAVAGLRMPMSARIDRGDRPQSAHHHRHAGRRTYMPFRVRMVAFGMRQKVITFFMSDLHQKRESNANAQTGCDCPFHGFAIKSIYSTLTAKSLQVLSL